MMAFIVSTGTAGDEPFSTTFFPIFPLKEHFRTVSWKLKGGKNAYILFTQIPQQRGVEKK
jgi:hypothetical protein